MKKWSLMTVGRKIARVRTGQRSADQLLRPNCRIINKDSNPVYSVRANMLVTI